MSRGDVPAVARLHCIAAVDQTNVRLGHPYLRAFFNFFVTHPDAIALVVTEGNDLIGYVVGARLPYRSALLRRVATHAVLPILRQPALWSQAARSVLSAVSSRTPAPEVPLDETVYSLVGIAVHPNARGRRVGNVLLRGFQTKVADLCPNATLRLTVRPENAAAIRAYERAGWREDTRQCQPSALCFVTDARMVRDQGRQTRLISSMPIDAVPKVAAVVATGRNHHFAALSVPSLCRAMEGMGRLIVVDNGFSTQYTQTLETLRRCHDFDHLKTGTALSYAAASNLGAAASEPFDYLIISNDDVVVTPEAISRLVDALSERSHTGIAAPELRYFDGRAQGSAYSDFSWLKLALLSRHSLRAKSWLERRRSTRALISHIPGMQQHRSYTEVATVPVAKGAFLAVEGSLWQLLGGFDERFTHYGEENDLCLRARRHGASCVVVPKALVFHYGRGSCSDPASAVRRSRLASLQLAQLHGNVLSRAAASALSRMGQRPEDGTRSKARS